MLNLCDNLGKCTQIWTTKFYSALKNREKKSKSVFSIFQGELMELNFYKHFSPNEEADVLIGTMPMSNKCHHHVG